MQKPIAALIEKIAKECQEANADKWTITKIVKHLSSQKPKGIKEMRKMALLMLQQLDPKAASIYASFQKMQVRTSNETIEPFDRGNIIKSLLRETEVVRGVAEKIGHEVEEKIKDLQIESISTSLIRELVNVKLLEYGHENIRNQYTRLGLPVFEVRKKVEQIPYSNKAMLTEYNLLHVIPSRLGKMHLSSQLFIGELQDFGTKPVALSIVPQIEETPRDTVFRLLEKANRLSRLSSWRPNISALNVAIAANSGKKTAREAALLFAKAVKAIFLSGKAVPAFNVLHLFEPDAFEKDGIERESMIGAATTMLKASAEEKSHVFENAVAIDTKYKLQLLSGPFPKMLLNCKNAEWNLVNEVALPGNGLCSFIALNLTSIALDSRKNEILFFEELAKRAKAVMQLDELKRKELGRRAYIKKQGIAVEEMHSALALDRLFEAGKTAIGTENAGEAIAFSERILVELKKQLPKSFVLTELRNKKAERRFRAQNRKSLGGRKQYGEEKQLMKSSTICRSYCFVAKAESRKELNELIDSNVRLIEFGEKEDG